MKQNILKKINARYVVATVLAVPFMARAAAGDIDVSTVVTAIVAAGAAAALIGAAVLVVKIGVKAWKWIASAG